MLFSVQSLGRDYEHRNFIDEKTIAITQTQESFHFLAVQEL